MKLIDNRKSKKVCLFADLPLGACFEDAEGYLCIKTYNDGACLYYSEAAEKWDCTDVAPDEKVTLLNSTIIIN